MRTHASRNECLNFISEVLSRNRSRAHLQYEEKQVASDGFMMNLNYILQKFAIGKLRADKVIVSTLFFSPLDY